MTNTNPGRLTAALLETADDMHLAGIINAAAQKNIKLWSLGDAKDIVPVQGGGNAIRITEPGKREPG